MFRKLLIVIAFSWIANDASSAGEALVVDGDTLELDGIKHRLHGIDAPEAGQKCNKANGKTWRYGDAATKVMETLIARKDVSCSPQDEDDYQRKTSVCSAGSIELNDYMVRNGHARAFRKFSLDYVGAEDVARSAKLGIWQAETQTAEAFRAEKWAVAKQVSPTGCPIKGNISRNGRIYHAPWSPWYRRTKINTAKGEQWFCSEAEALAAGWRAPYWGGR